TSPLILRTAAASPLALPGSGAATICCWLWGMATIAARPASGAPAADSTFATVMPSARIWSAFSAISAAWTRLGAIRSETIAARAPARRNGCMHIPSRRSAAPFHSTGRMLPAPAGREVDPGQPGTSRCREEYHFGMQMLQAPASDAVDLTALAARIRDWGAELGFDEVRITDTVLGAAESRLMDWLASGWHGEMEYMAAHGAKRARPAELVPGTVRVICARMNY